MIAVRRAVAIMAVMDDGDDLLPLRALPLRGTLDERRERRANVHRLMRDYIDADSEHSASLVERDENTDKITLIRPHPHMEIRLVRAALIKRFMTLSKRQRDVWLAVEFGVVRDWGKDGQWERRFLHPSRKGGMTVEEVGDYYHLMPSSVREYFNKANAAMVEAATLVRLD